MGFSKEDFNKFLPKRNGKSCFGSNKKTFNTDSIGRVSVYGFYAGMSSKLFFTKLCALTYKTLTFHSYYSKEEIIKFLEKWNFLFEQSDKSVSIIINDCFDAQCLGNFHLHLLYSIEKGCLDAILISKNTDSEDATNILYDKFVHFFKNSLSKTNLGENLYWNESEHEEDFFAYNHIYSVICNRQPYSRDSTHREILVIFSYEFRDCFAFNQKHLELVEMLNTQEQDLFYYKKEIENLKKKENMVDSQIKDIDRKLRLSKKFFCFGLVTFCIGFLMLGFAIGRLSSSSSNAEADSFQTAETAGGNVYVSDSPGSKRYHKDKNCPALKRTTGKITATDEANAIDQGKTLCGWCGK